jgi:hypothetical protein
MQSTKSRWSVVCGFSGDVCSGHRTEEMANKRAEQLRKSLWWQNMMGRYWELECAIRRLRASDPRYPKFAGKYLLPLAPELGVDPDDPRYPDIMGNYRHSCGSLAAYVQVVPAGSYFSRVIPTDNDTGGVETNELRWIVPTEGTGKGHFHLLTAVPDFAAAARARLAREAADAEMDHAFDDCRSTTPLPEHLAAMLRKVESDFAPRRREIEATLDADIPRTEEYNRE